METILGKELKDNVTGFNGIAIAVTEYLYGCKRISLQPKVKDDGTLPSAQWFDEPALIVIENKEHKQIGFKP